METILFDKIFILFHRVLFLYRYSIALPAISPLFYFKFTLQSWIYGIKKRNKFHFSSRNLNLKSLESTATSLLRFSNIYWRVFLADSTISMLKNIFQQAWPIIIHRNQFHTVYTGFCMRENITWNLKEETKYFYLYKLRSRNTRRNRE